MAQTLVFSLIQIYKYTHLFFRQPLTVLYLQNKFVASCKNIKIEQDLLFHFIPSPLLIAGSYFTLNLTRRKKNKYRRMKTYSRSPWLLYAFSVGRQKQYRNGHRKEENWEFEVENTEVKGLFRGTKWKVQKHRNG